MLQGPDPAVWWWGRRWGGGPRLSRVRWRVWCLAGQPASESIPGKPAPWCAVSFPPPSYLLSYQCLEMYVHLNRWLCASTHYHKLNTEVCSEWEKSKCMLYVSGRTQFMLIKVGTKWRGLHRWTVLLNSNDATWVSLPLSEMREERRNLSQLYCSSALYR